MSAPEIVACEGRAPKVKPLEWRDLTDRLSGTLYYSAAETPIGGVRAAKITDGKWTVEICGRKLRNYLDSVETYSTLHEAKAAAEADYTASVLACLERALETEVGRMASRLQEAKTCVNEEHALATPAASPATEPKGYHRLPNGQVCKCIKSWTHADGSRWCCLERPAASPSPAPAAVEELILRVRDLWDEDECPSLDRVDPLLDEIHTALSTLAADKARAEAERDAARRGSGFAVDKANEFSQAADDWRRRAGTAEARASALEGEVEKMRPHVAKIVGSVRINDSMGRVVAGQTEAATELGKLFAALSPAKETP